MDIIIGNIFSLIFAILFAISVIYEEKKNVVKWQLWDLFFGILSDIVLSSYAAVTTNVIEFLNDLLCYKDKLTLKKTVIICCLFVGIGLYTNNRGFMGLLPVIAETSFAIVMYTSKNAQQLRYGIIFNLPLWVIHDLYIQSYPAAIAEFTLTVWTIIQIFRHRKKKC